MYTQTIDEANAINLEEYLQIEMMALYQHQVENNKKVHFSTAAELIEYYEDGVEIIKWFKTHRVDFFTKKDWKLLGIEMPIKVKPLSTHPNVDFEGLLDVVLQNTKTNEIVIYDFKTSTHGWGESTKNDKTKISQLILYKTYYAEMFNIDPDLIKIEYLILKRKINEDAEYSSMKKRIQRFSPADGKPSRNRARKDFEAFIVENYNSDGTKIEHDSYPATAGHSNNNCTFCAFKDDNKLCPFSKRIMKSREMLEHENSNATLLTKETSQ